MLLIAALGMRANVTHRQNSTNEDIYGVAFVLCSPQGIFSHIYFKYYSDIYILDDDIGRIVKQQIIPFLNELRLLSLPHLLFIFDSPSMIGGTEAINEGDMLALTAKLNEVTTK